MSDLEKFETLQAYRIIVTFGGAGIEALGAAVIDVSFLPQEVCAFLDLHRD